MKSRSGIRIDITGHASVEELDDGATVSLENHGIVNFTVAPHDGGDGRVDATCDAVGWDRHDGIFTNISTVVVSNARSDAVVVSARSQIRIDVGGRGCRNDRDGGSIPEDLDRLHVSIGRCPCQQCVGSLE